MSDDAEANTLTSHTILLPPQVVRLLTARAQHQGRCLEFDIAMAVIQGVNFQCLACDMPALAHIVALEAQRYARLNGYADVVDMVKVSV